MINFSNINNLQELESSLKDLKLQQINLLDVYNGTGNPYFTDLLNSHLFMHSQKPAEILRKIVDVDMSFDITTDNIVQQLFNMNFFNQPTTKPHDEVAKILVENFNLQSDTQVQYNMNTSEKFIANVNQDRLVKTLNN